MMRLIDADKLDELVYEDAYGCPCVSMDDIDAQPTAYDVNAVVEQLKENTVIGADCTGKGFECIPTYKAIEIVIGGGTQ